MAGNVGVMIKSGDNTRTLVGAAAYVGGFQDSDSNRLVLSWFNRQPKRLQNAYTATRTFSFNSIAEINSEIRINFMAWADDPPMLGLGGGGFYMSSGAAGAISGIGIDVTNAFTGITVATTNATAPAAGIPPQTFAGLTENALHFAALLGNAGASSAGSWQKATSISGESFPTLIGSLRG